MKQVFSPPVQYATNSQNIISASCANEEFTSSFLDTEQDNILSFSKLISTTKNRLEFLLNLGVIENMPFREVKLVRFTNMISILIVLGIVLYIPFSIYTGSYFLAAIEGVDAMFVASALYFSYKKSYSTSKFILIGTVNVFIYINACYIGNEANVQHFYVLINIVPLLVFRLNQVKQISMAISLTIATFIFYQFTYPFFQSINLPMEVQLGTKQIGIWLDFVLFGAAIFMLAKNNFDVEEKLVGNNELLQAQAIELKRSNEDLEQFAYTISHDLRSPLRNIINFLSLLETRYTKELNEEAKTFIGFSVNASGRLEKLIEDLLSYSKVGRNLPQAQTIKSNEIIETIQFELKDKLLQTNQKISINGTMPHLKNVHSTMIYHIFQNLITNGLKFNKSKEPTVTICANENESHYIFEIKDNGIGISMEYKSKLFQMFKRLHTEEEFQGTGMGLAICKRIVNFYKGAIWFESKKGYGTSFYFSIPK